MNLLLIIIQNRCGMFTFYLQPVNWDNILRYSTNKLCKSTSTLSPVFMYTSPVIKTMYFAITYSPLFSLKNISEIDLTMSLYERHLILSSTFAASQKVNRLNANSRRNEFWRQATNINWQLQSEPTLFVFIAYIFYPWMLGLSTTVITTSSSCKYEIMFGTNLTVAYSHLRQRCKIRWLKTEARKRNTRLSETSKLRWRKRENTHSSFLFRP